MRGPNVGESRSSCPIPPPGIASVAVVTSLELVTPRYTPPMIAPSEWPRK